MSVAPAKRYGRVLFICIGALIGVCLSMFVTFSVVHFLYSDDWLPVQAEVNATQVASSREGTLTWTLNADVIYEVNGQRYDKANFKILHRSLREETLEEQKLWPAGYRFTLYVNSDNPNEASLSSDGGREALAVMLAILTPAFIIMVGFPALLVVRHLRRKRNSILRS